MSGSDYTLTPNYGLFKPIPNADINGWGGHLNSNADTLDSIVQGIQNQASAPITATGSTTPRSAQDRAADVANVLDYGAMPNTGTDSAPAINAACLNAVGTTHFEVFIPSGTYRVNSQINVQPNTVLRGAADHSTILFIDQSFSPAANGVLSLNGFDLGGPVIRDLTFQFAQPTDAITTTTAATAANGSNNTITVASTAGIYVGGYVSDTTNPTAIPVYGPTVASVAGNVVTISQPIAAPGVSSGDTIRFGTSRGNMKTLAAGATTGVGGTGVMYPPAIYAPGTQTTRVRLHNLHFEGAWDGIVGAPFWVTNIEMGALHIGWNEDAESCQDCIHLHGWHSWPFGIVGTGIGGVYRDGTNVGWNLGRIDGLNASGISFVGVRLVTTANANQPAAQPVPWTINGLMLDGITAGLTVNGGTLLIGQCYTSGSSQPGLPNNININAGIASFVNYRITQGGTLPIVSITGGIANFLGGYVAMANGNASVVSQAGGTFIMKGTYFNAAPTLTVPAIAQSGGVIQFQNNTTHAGTAGVFLAIGSDNPANNVTGNDFDVYTMTLPAEPLQGVYSGGFGGAYGQQLLLGATGQAGRMDFRRGTDGHLVAWIGASAANGGQLFDVTNVAGSSSVRLNAALNDLFLVGGVEVGRFDVNGLGISKVTAAAVAPGAGLAKLAFVAGTNAGTGKLVAYCGTSATPVTIMDNIGAGF